MITGRITGQKELEKALRRKRNAAKNMRELWRKIAVYMIGSVRKNFQYEGRPRWEPSERVIGANLANLKAGKTKVGGRTLRVTGTLMNSVYARQRSTFSMAIGSNVPYAKIHQYGGRTPPRVIRPVRAKALRWMGSNGQPVFAKAVRHPGSEIPARPFIVFHDDDRRWILRRFSEHLRVGVR